MTKKKQVTTTYKAFDKDFKCRDFQFEIGKEYTHDGEVEICRSGFHACENPFDCMNYYNITNSRFAIVNQSGFLKTHELDSKIVSSKIYIETELFLPQYIEKCIAFIFTLCKIKSGDLCKIKSGDQSKQVSTGEYSQQASSGYNSQQVSSGINSKQASTGEYSKQASSGYNSKQVSSGYNSKQASTGEYSKQVSTGEYSQQVSTGEYSQQVSSGEYSQQVSSGYNSQHTITGKNGVVASGGNNSSACGVNGTWISLAEYNDSGICVGFANGKIGENGLKENVWYKAKNGKLVKV